MAFRRRKLHAEGLPPIQITVQQPCNHFCNPKKNQDGLCPLLCLPLCFSTCKQTLSLPQDLLPPPPPDFTSSAAHHPVTIFRVSVFLPVFLLILAAACFLFSCYTVYKFYRNWRRGRSRASEGFSDSADEDHGVMGDDNPIWYIRTVGLQSSIINAITVCRYKRGEGLVEGTECGVCLNEFEEDQSVRLLPKCSHAFHIACIDTWLRSHTNCPMCRAGIITNISVHDSSSSSRESIGMGRENREDLEEEIETRNFPK